MDKSSGYAVTETFCLRSKGSGLEKLMLLRGEPVAIGRQLMAIRPNGELY
jgi:hypothetical protein